MRLDNVPAHDLVGADAAVVGALSTREPVLGPAVWPALGAEEGVLLLEAEPEVVLGVGLHQLGGLVAIVVLVRAPIRIPGLAHDQNVGLHTDGVGVQGHGADVHVGVVAGRLAGRGAIEVPFGKLLDALDSLFQCL